MEALSGPGLSLAPPRPRPWAAPAPALLLPRSLLCCGTLLATRSPWPRWHARAGRREPPRAKHRAPGPGPAAAAAAPLSRLPPARAAQGPQGPSAPQDPQDPQEPQEPQDSQETKGPQGSKGPLGPLGESREELLEDLQGLRGVPSEIREAAEEDTRRTATWLAGIGQLSRDTVAAILQFCKEKLLPDPDWRRWSPVQWALALGVSVLSLLLLLRTGQALLRPRAPVSAAAAQRERLLGELDPVDRARIFKLKHQLGEKRAVDGRRLVDLLAQDGTLTGLLEEAGVGSAAEVSRLAAAAAAGAAANEGPPPEFWVERQWWMYRPTMPYSWLQQKLDSYEVQWAVYSSDMRRLFVGLKGGFPSQFTVDIPVDPFLAPGLRARGVSLGVVPRSPWAFVRGVAVVAPSLALLCCVGAMQGRMQELMNERMYDLLKMDRFQLILPEEAREQLQAKEAAPGARAAPGAGAAEEGGEERSAFEDVVVGSEIWQTLEETLCYMRDPMRYYDKGVLLPRGILMSGPPGTGKTLLARSMARQCGLPFVFASGAEFVDSTSESGLDKVFNIFFTARANAPCFLFVDEIDALAGKSVVRDPERRAVYQEFLNELDGEVEYTDVDRFSRRQAVVLIVATNRPHELDDELMAPGRIDREITFSLPSEEQRIDIFRVHSRARTLAPSVDFAQLAFRTVGFSGADIRNLVNESSIIAVRKGHQAIEQGDIVAALDKQLFESLGVSMADEESLTLYDKVPSSVRELLAAHEAGHVLLAHLFPSFDWHAFTDILPAGQESALTVFYPRQSMLQLGHTTEGYVRMQMVVAMGGRCAERVLFGDEQVTDAAQDDIIRVSRLARELACSASSSRLGILPITMHPIMDPPPLPGEAKLIPDNWSRPGTQLADMSVELSELFTREVTRYIDEAESMAMGALQANKPILVKLAQQLQQQYRISGLDAAELIDSMQPQRLPDLTADHTDSTLQSPLEEPKWDPEQPGRYKHLEIYAAPLHRC